MVPEPKRNGRKIIEEHETQFGPGKVRINLIAGTHKDIYEYFMEKINEFGLVEILNKNVFIL